MFDAVIRGGHVVDGSGRAPFRADVAVDRGRIVAVDRLDGASARREIDAVGRLVVPGFVDAHVHADARVLDPDVQLALLRQGVTTVILGQDGLSFAPSDAATLRWVNGYFGAVNGGYRAAAGIGVAGLLARYRHATAVNTAYLAPHGTIRRGVLGGARRAPSSVELGHMLDQVCAALDEGAVGLSTGLGYVPGSYADAAELTALARPLARRDLPYVTHMRGYEEHAARGMAEVVRIGRDAGVPVHVSHYHGPAGPLAALMDDARADLDATFDSYPYHAGSSILGALLPDWLPHGDPDTLGVALSDPTVPDRIAAEVDPRRWAAVTLAHVPHQRYRWCEGMRLTEAAAQTGRPPARFCVDLLVATGFAASMVFEHPPSNNDEAVRALLAHPAHMGGSDGIYIGRFPHPRGYGAFARFLGRHVRELRDWGWPDAVAHLATRPAERFRLSHRGTVRRGQIADLVVVDPDLVSDKADYGKPHELAVGIDDVLVAGVPVLSDGTLTGARPGMPLMPN